jgi:hypothetical protein
MKISLVGSFVSACLLAGLALAAGCEENLRTGSSVTAAAPTLAPFPADYKGTPWEGKAQVIPGQVLAAYYDVGGNGVAYQNQDTKNHGSGELNQGPEPKNHFRQQEGISISYTKAAFDKWPDGDLLPLDLYYVGWTVAGESLNYTVDVKAAGLYQINLMASSNNEDARISFLVNGVDQTGPIPLVSTHNWHTWGLFKDVARVRLNPGRQLLTFKILKEGNMNIHFMEFVPVK